MSTIFIEELVEALGKLSEYGEVTTDQTGQIVFYTGLTTNSQGYLTEWDKEGKEEAANYDDEE